MILCSVHNVFLGVILDETKKGCGKEIALGKCGEDCIPCDKPHLCLSCSNQSPTEIGSQPNLGESPKEEDTSTLSDDKLLEGGKENENN